jgi:hypothetical protein
MEDETTMAEFGISGFETSFCYQTVNSLVSSISQIMNAEKYNCCKWTGSVAVVAHLELFSYHRTKENYGKPE